jgi:RNA polymerase sigma factor (sigma-70 family)
MTDRELLRDYSTSGSSEAFAEIVRRHSAMVHSACKRILGDAHAAEDAAQAAFLIFMRKANKLREDTVLSGWLFLTAQHAALNERKRLKRRERHERKAAVVREERGKPAEVKWDDVRPELDSAIAALPRRQRDALVLYYMGGRTEKEVAREMGCARGTVAAHLSAAVSRLRGKLKSHGVVVPAAMLATFLSERAVEAAPVALADSIIAACTGTAAASVAATTIAKGTLKTLAWAKAKVAVAVLSAATVVAGGGTAAVAVLNPGAEPICDNPAIVAQLQALRPGESALLPEFVISGVEDTPENRQMRRLYANGPGARGRCRRILSASDRGTALYCGGVHRQYQINDVWEFHLGANTWNLICPSDGGNPITASSARAAARLGRKPERNMAYYRAWYRDNVVVEGGTVRTRVNRGPLSPIQTWDQLAYDHHSGKIYWMLSAGSDFRKLETYAHATGQDVEKLRPLLKAGTSLWSFDPETRKWDRQFGPQPRPKAGGMGGTLRYIPSIRKLVWYVAAQNTHPYEFEMWCFDPASNSWEQLQPNGGASLADMSAAGAAPGCYIQSAYSSKLDRLVVVSGENTWAYDFATERWEHLAADAQNNARDDITVFAYDSNTDLFLLLQPGKSGRRKLGKRPEVKAVPGRLRAFDLDSREWRTLPVNGPPVPSGAVTGYWDPRFGVLVVQSRSRRVWVYRPSRDVR